MAEVWGEDPLLLSRMAAAYVRGLQGPPDVPFVKAGATCKVGVPLGRGWCSHYTSPHRKDRLAVVSLGNMPHTSIAAALRSEQHRPPP